MEEEVAGTLSDEEKVHSRDFSESSSGETTCCPMPSIKQDGDLGSTMREHAMYGLLGNFDPRGVWMC